MWLSARPLHSKVIWVSASIFTVWIHYAVDPGKRVYLKPLTGQSQLHLPVDSGTLLNDSHLLFLALLPQTATLRPYLNAVRDTLQAALCLENFSSQVVERHNKPEVEVRWVLHRNFECDFGAIKTEQRIWVFSSSCPRTDCVTDNDLCVFVPLLGVVKSCSSSLWSSAVTTRRKFWLRAPSTPSGSASLSSRSVRLPMGAIGYVFKPWYKTDCCLAISDSSDCCKDQSCICNPDS